MLFENTSLMDQLNGLVDDDAGISQAMAVVVIAAITVVVVIAVMTLLGDSIHSKAVEVAGDIQGASW